MTELWGENANGKCVMVTDVNADVLLMHIPLEDGDDGAPRQAMEWVITC